MKALIRIIAITFIAFTSKASEAIPYTAMRVDTGYAIDANGVRHPNPLCLHNAVYAPRPTIPVWITRDGGSPHLDTES